jgi:tetratricopeptide (TPR) repeat protein
MNQVRAEFRRVDPAGVSYGQWDFNLEAQLWYRQAEAIIQSERWAAAFELIRQRQFAKAIDAFAPLLKADDNSGVDWGSRANCYAELGRWPEAAADYAHSLSLGRDYVPGFRNHCLAALQVGDKDTYLNLCRETLQRFADSTDRATLNTVAWLCALDPSAEAETGRALELIDKALRESQFNTYVHTRACLLYRAKRFDEALKQLDDLIARPGYAASAFDWLFLAMTCHQLGQTEKARENLDKSIAWMTANPQQDWQRRVELERFRAEAVALIGAKK